MGPLLIEAFRYHKWANLYLLDRLANLDDEDLQLTAAGTYGSLAETLMHLLGAEQRYIRRLSGVEPRISEKDAFPGVPALIKEAEVTGDQLIELAARLRSDDEIETLRSNPYTKLSAGVVLLQALHHGNDHRTHICTILGTHGLEYADLDVWAYGLATGASVRPQEARC